MRLIQHPNYQQIAIADVLYALGDPVRLEIVRRLAIDGEQPCACLCAGVDAKIAKSTMSHHFRILRAAGVILTRKEGTQLLNSLRRDDLDALFPGLLDIVVSAVEPEIARIGVITDAVGIEPESPEYIEGNILPS